MEITQKQIDIAKILVNVFLVIVIGLFCWQMFTYEKVVRDIVVGGNPTTLLDLYTNLTGKVCSIANNINQISILP